MTTNGCGNETTILTIEDFFQIIGDNSTVTSLSKHIRLVRQRS